jgi:hypothetical protein
MAFSTTSSTQGSSGLTYTQASSSIASDPKAEASTAKDQVNVNLPGKGGDNRNVKPQAAINTKPNQQVAKDVVGVGQTVEQFANRGQAVISEVATLLMNKSPIINSHIQNFGGSILALLLSINAIANEADVETQKQLSDSQGKFNQLYAAFADQVTEALSAMCKRGQVLTDNANSELKTQLGTMEETSRKLMIDQCLATFATSALSVGFTHYANRCQSRSTQLEGMSTTMKQLQKESKANSAMGPLKLSTEELGFTRDAVPAALKGKIDTVNNSLAEIDGFSRAAGKSTFSRDMASPDKIKQLDGVIKNLEDFSKDYSPHLERVQRYTEQEVRLRSQPNANATNSEHAISIQAIEAHASPQITPEIEAAAKHLESFKKRLDLHVSHMDDPTVKIPHDMEFTDHDWHYIREGHIQGVIPVNANPVPEFQQLANGIREKVGLFNGKLANGPHNLSQHLADPARSNQLATGVLDRVKSYTSFAKDLKVGYTKMASTAKWLDGGSDKPAKEYNAHEVRSKAGSYSQRAALTNGYVQGVGQALHTGIGAYFTQQGQVAQSTYQTDTQTISNNLGQTTQVNQSVSQSFSQIDNELLQSILQFTQSTESNITTTRQSSDSRNGSLWSMFAQLIGMFG